MSCVSCFMRAAMVLCAFTAVGCATGPKYPELKSQFPPIESGQGRIVLYRVASPVGAAVQPEVKVNAVVVGHATPAEFIRIERPTGSYEISCSTEANNSATVRLAPGQTAYVNLRIQMGFLVGHVQPIIEDEATAMKTLGDCIEQKK